MRLARLSFLLSFAAALLMLGGCASNSDPENMTERPWNAPKSWEHGLPTGMNRGR